MRAMIVGQMYANNDKTSQPHVVFISFFFSRQENEHFLQTAAYITEETFCYLCDSKFYTDMATEKKEEKELKHIVIVGGGFAGFLLSKHVDHKQYRVTLVDRKNFHAFPPLFYQIASSGLEPAAICFPFRKELRKLRHVRFRMGEALSIDTQQQILRTNTGDIEYDYLVLATGTTNNFFNMPELRERVYTLKSTAEAIRLRNEILFSLERAGTCSDPEKRRTLLCFTVVGGGPTGVEIAGALGEMKKYILAREYPEINPCDMRVVIVEGANRLLQNMSPEASVKARQYLEQLEVEVITGHTMKSFDGTYVDFDNGAQIKCHTLIWTAGITGEPLQGIPESSIGRGKRIITDEFNRVKGCKNIFAIGDIALLSEKNYPNGHPQVAQVAIQQSELLAKNLNKNRFETPFRYKDKGNMATIGRNRAVADLPYIKLYGRPAWFTWMGVHLVSILGMKNKIITLLNWCWYYFTYNATLRLLIRPTRYPKRNEE